MTHLLLKEFSEDNLLHQMARYHLSTGGKYLRGRLALSEAEALGIPQDTALTWGLACELLHNATLIHDDIQDNDPIRRGQPSLWKKYGVSQAINAGDLLIFKAFELAASLNNAELPMDLAKAAQSLAVGQADELNNIFRKDQNLWSTYLTIAQRKTGSLFQLPIQGIHILKDFKNSEQLEAWLDFGVCYQIYDDIKDFMGQKQSGQKQKDFTETRLNAVVSWLWKNSENHNLICEYVNTKPHSSEQRKLIQQLNTVVAQQKVIPELYKLASQKLDHFKKTTHAHSQKVILKFMTTESPKNREPNNEVSI